MNLGKHFDAHSCSGFLRLIILWEHQAMKCCYHHPDCTVHTVGLCRSKWIRPAFNALHSHSNLSIVLPRAFLIGRHIHTQLLYPCRSLKCCRSRWLCPSLSIRSLDIVFCFTKHIYHYCFNLVLRAHQHYGGLDTNTSMLGPSCPRPTPTNTNPRHYLPSIVHLYYESSCCSPYQWVSLWSIEWSAEPQAVKSSRDMVCSIGGRSGITSRTCRDPLFYIWLSHFIWSSKLDWLCLAAIDLEVILLTNSHPKN